MVPSVALARRSQARGGRRSVPSSEGGRGQPGRLIGRGSLPSLPALHVRVGGPVGAVSNRSRPQSVLAHLMHGQLSYTKLKCGAIGPVLKHGPRSYTLSRVEGDGRALHAQRKQVVEPAFRTCEGTDGSLPRGRGCWRPQHGPLTLGLGLRGQGG